MWSSSPNRPTRHDNPQRMGDPGTLSNSLVNISVKFLLILVFIWASVQAADQDSLAYIFRQDNLSTNNDLQLRYKIGLTKSTLLIDDAVRTKVFSYEDKGGRDQQFSVEHRLRSDWSWGHARKCSIRLESSQYKDHRTGMASTIKNWALLGGIRHDEAFSLFFGGRSIERYGIVERGWTTELDMKKNWKTGSQRSAIAFVGSRDQLAEHLSHSLDLRANYLIRFGNISTFQSSFQRETRRQSFFTDSLGSSQSRAHDHLQWQNRIAYNLGNDIQLYHRLTWGNQLTKINQETVGEVASMKLSGEERKRFYLVNETGMEFIRKHFSSTTAFRVDNSQNKYFVDYTQILYQLKEELAWHIPGWVDSLSSRTTLSRLEYNTPDTTNDDDRDEWRLNTQLSFGWWPNPFYHIDLGTKLSLFHLIYLFNTRSSENHWNRNLILWSSFTWRRQSWRGEGSARIHSNYFDYDYDDLFIALDQPSRSFVHRSLDLQKQLTYRFNRRWSVTSKLAARWEDEGQLNWDAFVQQISSNRKQWELTAKLFYDYRGWEGWVGYLTHERQTEYTVQNRESELWHGEGPLFGVQHHLGDRLTLDADARFISVKDQDREYLLPKVYVTLIYR